MMHAMIITIDGPAGSGKSTAARKLAARLGIAYLDTGAMYRVVTLAALDAGADLSSEEALARLAAAADFHLDCGPTHVRVTLDGEDVTEEIRSMRVSDKTSVIAASPGVRRVLVDKQRQIGRLLGSVVTEGRDQGSVVFPDAAAKFFLVADLHSRAERRFFELRAEGEDVTLAQVTENLRQRDEIDSRRAVAPLTRPQGAIEIDTTHLSIAQVLDKLLEHLGSRGLIPQDGLHHHHT